MHFLWGLVTCFSVVISVCSGALSEKELQTKLFEDYKSDVIPRSNISAAIKVTMDFRLLSIAEVDERKQVFKIRGFLEVKWNDNFLRWKPHIYGGIRKINVPNDKIWQPDLALLDTYDSLTDLGQLGGRAVVDSSGNVIMWPYKMYAVGCKIKVRHFPFDVQICKLDFLSWTNPVSVLDLRVSMQEFNRDRYIENEEWWLDNVQTSYYLQPYGADQWAHIKYTFTLRRKWLFYTLNIIAPIMCISFLNVATFLLPAASGEKITLCISTFLTLAVFLTIITTSLPESSDELSILGWYVGLQLLGNGSSILCTVISLRLYTKDITDKMPAIVKFLCRLCCHKRQAKFDARDHRNGSGRRHFDRKMSTVSSSCAITVQDPDITWVSASYTFDRLCLWTAVCWHVGLGIGLVVGYLE